MFLILGKFLKVNIQKTVYILHYYITKIVNFRIHALFSTYRPESKCALLGSVNTISNMAGGCSSIIHQYNQYAGQYGFQQSGIGRNKYSNIDKIYLLKTGIGYVPQIHCIMYIMLLIDTQYFVVVFMLIIEKKPYFNESIFSLYRATNFGKKLELLQVCPFNACIF